MEDEKIKENGIENVDEEKKKSPGCLGLGFSLFFPIIGVIMYFVKRSDKFDASGYLIAAAAGAIISVLLKTATGAI